MPIITKMNTAYHNSPRDERPCKEYAESLLEWLKRYGDSEMPIRFQSGRHDDQYDLEWSDVKSGILQDYMFSFSDFQNAVYEEEISLSCPAPFVFHIAIWSYIRDEMAGDILGFRRIKGEDDSTDDWEQLTSKYDWYDLDKIQDEHWSKDTDNLFFIHVPSLFEVVVNSVNEDWEEHQASKFIEPPIEVPKKEQEVKTRILRRKIPKFVAVEDFEHKVNENILSMEDLNRGK